MKHDKKYKIRPLAAHLGKAVKTVLASEKFNEDAKKDPKLRVFRQRWNEGKIGNGAAVRLILAYGFSLEPIDKKTGKSA